MLTDSGAPGANGAPSTKINWRPSDHVLHESSAFLPAAPPTPQEMLDAGPCTCATGGLDPLARPVEQRRDALRYTCDACGTRTKDFGDGDGDGDSMSFLVAEYNRLCAVGMAAAAAAAEGGASIPTVYETPNATLWWDACAAYAEDGDERSRAIWAEQITDPVWARARAEADDIGFLCLSMVRCYIAHLRQHFDNYDVDWRAEILASGPLTFLEARRRQSWATAGELLTLPPAPAGTATPDEATRHAIARALLNVPDEHGEESEAHGLALLPAEGPQRMFRYLHKHQQKLILDSLWTCINTIAANDADGGYIGTLCWDDAREEAPRAAAIFFCNTCWGSSGRVAVLDAALTLHIIQACWPLGLRAFCPLPAQLMLPEVLPASMTPRTAPFIATEALEAWGLPVPEATRARVARQVAEAAPAAP